MLQILVLVIPIVLLAFWAWMFNDMTKNDLLPPCFISISSGRNVRQDWMVAFVVLNIFTAGYYYLTEYIRK